MKVWVCKMRKSTFSEVDIAALRWLLLFSPFPSCFSFYLPPSFLFPFSSAPSFLLPLLTSIPQKKALSLLRTPHRALFQLWLTGESSDEQWQLSRLCGAQETVRALPSATTHQPTPANCRLQTPHCKLQTANCKLQTAINLESQQPETLLRAKCTKLWDPVYTDLWN